MEAGQLLGLLGNPGNARTTLPHIHFDISHPTFREDCQTRRADANPTSAASVDFTVTFSECVTGVQVSDFRLTTTGVSGATVSGVSGPTIYMVSINTDTGAGTIRLDVVDHDTIVDLANNPLGGVGEGNGSYTSGETYDVRLYRTYLPLVVRF